jgi:hypothetical protein
VSNISEGNEQIRRTECHGRASGFRSLPSLILATLCMFAVHFFYAEAGCSSGQYPEMLNELSSLINIVISGE